MPQTPLNHNRESLMNYCLSLLWSSTTRLVILWNSSSRQRAYTLSVKRNITSSERHTLKSKAFKWITIDHMHMTSQKGAHVCWGSNEALPRGPSPSMQPAGPTPACHTAGLGGLARAAHWLRGWCALPAQHVRAARQVSTPSMASLLWRRDVNA